MSSKCRSGRSIEQIPKWATDWRTPELTLPYVFLTDQVMHNLRQRAQISTFQDLNEIGILAKTR